ncbi:hypothetical protein SVAN01_02891 [Stagonosporopsis vannaccii]|nr:hypothetical protein SVAN01_02891 [Stagonosporopsis vannaccii]
MNLRLRLTNLHKRTSDLETGADLKSLRVQPPLHMGRPVDVMQLAGVASTAVLWLTPLAATTALRALWRGSRWPYPAASSGSLSKEHANAAPLIISYSQSVMLLRLKCTSWLCAFPDEAVRLARIRLSPLVAFHTAAEMPSAALTNMPTPAAMVVGHAE